MFTLLELFVVIGMIAVLIANLMPALISATSSTASLRSGTAATIREPEARVR